MAEEAANIISKDPSFSQYSKDSIAKALYQRIKLKNPTGTDIIQISISWGQS